VWTAAKKQSFIELLAMTGKVRMAARAVGMSDRSARDLRLRDPAFDLSWHKALNDGYDRMEEELLARAMGRAEGEEGTTDGFDPVLAMKLLQMRAAGQRSGGRGAIRAPMSPASDQEALDAKLLARLDALAEQLQKRS
jgi:hypothetical protein